MRQSVQCGSVGLSDSVQCCRCCCKNAKVRRARQLCSARAWRPNHKSHARTDNSMRFRCCYLGAKHGKGNVRLFALTENRINQLDFKCEPSCTEDTLIRARRLCE